MSAEQQVKDFIEGLIWDLIYADRRTQAADRQNYRDENEERIAAWHKLEEAIAEHYCLRTPLPSSD